MHRHTKCSADLSTTRWNIHINNTTVRPLRPTDNSQLPLFIYLFIYYKNRTNSREKLQTTNTIYKRLNQHIIKIVHMKGPSRILIRSSEMLSNTHQIRTEQTAAVCVYQCYDIETMVSRLECSRVRFAQVGALSWS